mmetsp:Transcript_29834/g.50790  ORF Transcript_29834/g.50790 Transcript_29834/m.50790 type:complete len:81 (-) Transcript_29834:506-748(-)
MKSNYNDFVVNGARQVCPHHFLFSIECLMADYLPLIFWYHCEETRHQIIIGVDHFLAVVMHNENLSGAGLIAEADVGVIG